MECKNKKYSLLMCNEFNFFLYFKDKEYFEEVVRPSIAAKKEKTLIDYFLLEDYNQFNQFKHVSVYDSLNALEQCLLIAVINMTEPETARMLADQFVNKAKLVETKAAKKNQKFDTVLLMKILESDEVEDDEDEKVPGGDQAQTKKRAVKRQRSMSASSNSSIEEMNWAKKQMYDDDEDDYGEGEEDEGECGGGGGGGYESNYDDYNVEAEQCYEDEMLPLSDYSGDSDVSGQEMRRNVRQMRIRPQGMLQKQYST